jgi:hypothetical protein
MDFCFWKTSIEDDSCALKGLKNVPDFLGLYAGKPMSMNFPPEAMARMDKDTPKITRLADVVTGVMVPVISPKVKAILESEGVEGVEYLPFKIINHKGKVASNEYCLLNPLVVIDCIDTERSVLRWNLLDPEMIMSSRSLVVKESALPTSRSSIFRPAHWLFKIVISKPLAELLASEGCTGLYFNPFSGYQGL